MTFTNYIETNGETRKGEELSEKEKKEIGIVLENRFMEAAGYRRVGRNKEEGEGCRGLQS